MLNQNSHTWNFPGGLVVRILCFNCRGHGFDPCSWDSDPACHGMWPKKKRKKKFIYSEMHRFYIYSWKFSLISHTVHKWVHLGNKHCSQNQSPLLIGNNCSDFHHLISFIHPWSSYKRSHTICTFFFFFYWVNMSQFVAVFFCWWILDLFLIWGSSVNTTGINILVQVFLWLYVFISLG